MKNKLSVIIIARDEEEMIGDCLKSVAWADEVVVIDTGSVDKTVTIAQKQANRVIELKFTGHDFSGWRNRGLKEARNDWLFYLDADERVTPLLKKEIIEAINGQGSGSRKKTFPTTKYRSPVTGYAIPRRNFYLGKEMHHGGTWPDYVQRLFQRKKLKAWRDKLHEHPEFAGKMGKLQNPLIHLAHRDLTSMLAKTISWTEIEARLLFKANHPSIVWWRILRMMLTKFWERVVKQQAWRDGTEGWINSIFEVFDTFIIYARLWEMQSKNQEL